MKFNLENMENMTRRVECSIAIANKVHEGLMMTASSYETQAAKMEACGRITAQILENEKTNIFNL
jgi:hypothetical protein